MPSLCLAECAEEAKRERPLLLAAMRKAVSISDDALAANVETEWAFFGVDVNGRLLRAHLSNERAERGPPGAMAGKEELISGCPLQCGRRVSRNAQRKLEWEEALCWICLRKVASI
ncbi:hypothetical protein CEXT_260611 [Caerostris extrusa]|uniref:Uncharacterized protein n=1 Tax=Caerostris extrusa TaxID=172846 RepID=A0AAV4XUX9_CAEEX|nr:hypothetical protein CEXT_260611 [Caerostris extrusa]